MPSIPVESGRYFLPWWQGCPLVNEVANRPGIPPQKRGSLVGSNEQATCQGFGPKCLGHGPALHYSERPRRRTASPYLCLVCPVPVTASSAVPCSCLVPSISTFAYQRVPAGLIVSLIVSAGIREGF